MERFLAQHQANVSGVLSGFDRVVFRGTLPSINNPICLDRFMSYYKISYRDFGTWDENCSDQIVTHAKTFAAARGRAYRYVASPKASKEKIVQEIIESENIREGLVCVLGCVENGFTYRHYKN